MSEPFGYRPRELAELTDWQVIHILAAQGKRDREAREEMERQARERGEGGPASSPPKVDREFAISYLIENHGHTRESAAAAVDEANREGG